LFVGIYSKKLFPTKNFTPSKVSDCPDFFSNHEEADTRMLLHAIHADTRFGDMNVLQAITCIHEDSEYGKYHGLEDSDDHPLFL
jgi:hypothetical protein